MRGQSNWPHTGCTPRCCGLAGCEQSCSSVPSSHAASQGGGAVQTGPAACMPCRASSPAQALDVFEALEVQAQHRRQLRQPHALLQGRGLGWVGEVVLVVCWWCAWAGGGGGTRARGSSVGKVTVAQQRMLSADTAWQAAPAGNTRRVLGPAPPPPVPPAGSRTCRRRTCRLHPASLLSCRGERGGWRLLGVGGLGVGGG